MWPFKPKMKPYLISDEHKRLNDCLDDTNRRMEEVLQKLRDRAGIPRPALTLVKK